MQDHADDFARRITLETGAGVDGIGEEFIARTGKDRQGGLTCALCIELVRGPKNLQDEIRSQSKRKGVRDNF